MTGVTKLKEWAERNKRKYWWFWLIWALAFVAIETYALVTDEKQVPTLSRTIWWLKDRWRWFATALFLFLLWLGVHLVGGECFAGLC